MKSKFLTVIIIIGIAAFIYYNKSSWGEKFKIRRSWENRIEEVTGTEVDLRKFFKGMEGVSDSLEDMGSTRAEDLKKSLEKLTDDEKNELLELLSDSEEKGSSLFEDLIKTQGE